MYDVGGFSIQQRQIVTNSQETIRVGEGESIDGKLLSGDIRVKGGEWPDAKGEGRAI